MCAAGVHYADACARMLEAKEQYVAGFHVTHPKVAWAFEGLGRIYEKQQDLQAALDAFRQAADIRRSLQSSSDKQMFNQELAAVERAIYSIERSSERTQSSEEEVAQATPRERMKKSFHNVLTKTATSSSLRFVAVVGAASSAAETQARLTRLRASMKAASVEEFDGV